jgi:hypothetical protein
MVMWMARPAGPNTALASGMPTCMVLPKASAMPRVAGAAGAAAASRRAHRNPASISASSGTKTAASVRQGSAARSARSAVRNSSAGMNRWMAAAPNTRPACGEPSHCRRPSPQPAATTPSRAASLAATSADTCRLARASGRAYRPSQLPSASMAACS